MKSPSPKKVKNDSLKKVEDKAMESMSESEGQTEENVTDKKNLTSETKASVKQGFFNNNENFSKVI